MQEQPTRAGTATLSPQAGDTVDAAALDLAALDQVQRRVLWLATNMIHHANHLRPNPDGSKVGGHQASSASVVSILTALYLAHLRPGDRVLVKPHASPVFHALQYLLGNLDRAYLPQLRTFHGLQAYPSRTKDPDHPDFSGGSVGLGPVAPLFAALADRYAGLHFGPQRPRRFISIVGDAELDEGNVWEAIGEEAVAGLGNVLWIVDLNRQSLDRVVPGIRAARLKALFAGNGWHVVEAKYGRRLQAAFSRPHGEALRHRIDDMSNEEYQAMIRLPGPEARLRLLDTTEPGMDALAQAVADVPDDDLPDLLADLGGHDLSVLLETYAAADRVTAQPTIIFAYTIKGWGLSFAGDAHNHSALLNQTQIDRLRDELAVPLDDEWAAFPATSTAGQLCASAAARLASEPAPAASALRPEDIPHQLGGRMPATLSTQEAFGNLVASLARVPGLAERLVTTSPDVAVSTSLGNWINRAGVFASEAQRDFTPETQRMLRWQPGPRGQHIELGISEMNLFMLLGQLGLSAELNGQLLLPIGTVYDCFVLRGLDALVYSLYSGAKFVFAGTPSGISLAPEGGAHQSTVTNSLGMELPNLHMYEPAFGREVEWCLLQGLRSCCDRDHGRATYLRLTTRAIDQTIMEPALARLGEDELRRQVLAGGYRLIEPPAGLVGPVAHIAATGAVMPEAAEAARLLHAEGVAAVVLNLTSPDRLYAGLRHVRRGHVVAGTVSGAAGHLEELIAPADRRAPIVTALDGASHALAFLGGVFGAPVVPLGVDRFGQSGLRADLFRDEAIDAESIANAVLVGLGLGL
ncbi:MAG: pyruvate dehydrogenase [Chloroflexi bacterium]|nr:pyruvate dehydrogenase [Chloroflexota bacterium]